MMPKKKKFRTARWGVPLLLAGIGCLIVSSAIFFFRGRETLRNLIEHGQNVRTTDVYGRWWTLSRDSGLTWDGVLAELKALEYDEVANEPQHPGQFRAFYPTIVVYLHDFQYPDRALAAQAIRIQFVDHRLDRVDAPGAPAGITEWRLEPRRLAQWAGDAGLARPQVRLSDLPAYVPRAVLAMEDKRFYQHGAFDFLGVLRAFTVDLRHGGLRQGASTISQQLARSVFLSARRTLSRKLMEAVLALYLEFRFSKEQLLEMYLNQVYWGQDGASSVIGIESASRAYFGKPARELSLPESALLAGILQSPNHYSPRAAPRVALERRNLVLKLLRDQSVISGPEYQRAKSEPLGVIPPAKRTDDSAYFLATLQDQLEERYPGVILPTAGWKIFTTLDPVLEHDAIAALRHVRRGPQAALVALDPRSGGVRAWVGGTDFTRAPYDRAARSRRQPGSTFKTFVMLAALDKKVATEATLLKDVPLSVPAGAGRWSPHNFDHRYRQQVSLWDALVQSLNVPTVALALQTGLPAIADYARRAGIESPIREFPSMALGASEVGLPELTNAYATLAAGGVFHAPYDVESVVDGDGRVLETHAREARSVINPASVFLVTQMLRAVLREGTGFSSRALGLTIDAAGKTGTSENFQDGWFVGYTPQLACGVWVGYDQPKSLGLSGALVALPVWAPFMQMASTLEMQQPFVEPPGIVWREVDPQSGLLVRSGCPARRRLPFLAGTEPTGKCPLHTGGIVGFFKRLLGAKPAAPKFGH